MTTRREDIHLQLPAHYEAILRRLCLNIQDDAWVGFGKQDKAMAKRILKQLDGHRKSVEARKAWAGRYEHSVEVKLP